MLKLSLDRTSNNIKALFQNAVAEIRNFNVNGSRINFELFFYADEQARLLLVTPQSPTTSSPTPMPGMASMDGGTVMRKNFSEEVSIIEAYEPDDSTATPTEQLKSCCYKWLIEKHYPTAI